MSDLSSKRVPDMESKYQTEEDDNNKMDISVDYGEVAFSSYGVSQRGALHQVAPPNTPFNSLSIKQATSMMTKLSGSNSTSHTSIHENIEANHKPLRSHVKWNQSSVRSIFDKENEIECSKDGIITDSAENDYEKGTFDSVEEQRKYSIDDEWPCTARAPPNSPLKTKDRVASKDEQDTITESDIIRQSKLKEIQWQLRFPVNPNSKDKDKDEM